MNQRHSYLLVEGQQDVYFLGCLLQTLGLHPVQQADQVPRRWAPFLDSVLCQRDRSLRQQGRPGIPFWQVFKITCLLNDSHVVAIESVGGNRVQFGRTLRATRELIGGGFDSLTAVGVIADADTDPAASLASARDALRSAGLVPPYGNEQIVAGTPNSGVFVLPGGSAAGGLEDLLTDCAAIVYPELLSLARSYVDSVNIDSGDYAGDDMREMRTPQGPVKAVVGAVSSVLKPGASIQVSILRDRWVSPTTMGAVRVAALVQFLKSLCGIP